MSFSYYAASSYACKAFRSCLLTASPTFMKLMLLLLDYQSKPYTAVTVQINRLTSEQYEADDMSGIVDLIEVIRLQTGGPTEAARAIRKKL